MRKIAKYIPVKKLANGELKSLELEHDGCSITIASSFIGGCSFSGSNLFDSFKKLNTYLQANGWLPLCNGARGDVMLSGGLADVSGGAMLYVDNKEEGYPLVYIFDTAQESDIKVLA
ncbi:hypothetical protein [Hahella sp. HN01]|uniref:hypothetical protein n=1 Tax=Hahella sp. HN01 TaxID=2847262 RepID=UPI001C1F199A|nr:hypothetical protein [Hahella sp. HN01]MBU6955298.1 hypothetical protein [Hahella sp. HN01]